MSIVNPLLLQLYTFDWQNVYMICMIYDKQNDLSQTKKFPTQEKQ